MRILQAIPSPLPTVYSIKNSSNVTELNFDLSLSETEKPGGGYKCEKKNMTRTLSEKSMDQKQTRTSFAT
jgi:hypothetical protein